MKKITKFKTGAIRDTSEDKENLLEGISWLALKRFAKYMDTKSIRYGRGNWKKGIPPEEYLKSMLRHVQKFVSEWEYGVCEEYDDHLGAIFFNLQGLMHEIELIKLGIDRFEISKEYKKIYGKKYY